VNPNLSIRVRGREIKNWADSLLSVFCLSDYGQWLRPSAEVKLPFALLSNSCVFLWLLFGNGISISSLIPSYFQLLFTYLLVLLGFDLRALNLLSSHSATWATPSALFTFVVLIGPHCLCRGWPGLQSSYLHFLSRWDDRCVPSCPAFIGLRWGSFKLFALAGLEPESS
jgi:fumarate reductase subunit D